MTIDPYILLGVGSFFAALYAAVIVVGWARTRHNRRVLQNEEGCSVIHGYSLKENCPNPRISLRSISLSNNIFRDSSGADINPDEFQAYIATDTSPEFPDIKTGNLLFVNSAGRICYVFDVPDLHHYR